MKKYLATVSYLGRDYNGFQRQSKLPSIQGELERALSFMGEKDIKIHGAGRTDKGVHARGQTFTFLFKEVKDPAKFIDTFNRLLPSDISILSLKEVDEGFDARHSCSGKHYCYRFVLNEKDPFRVDEYSFRCRYFDDELFLECLKAFEGQHDFKNYTTKDEDVDSYIRTVESIETIKNDSHYEIHFRANGFMRYMVRIMMGVAFKAAQGKMSIDEIKKSLSGEGKRKIISFKAAPEGLTLEEVYYEE